MKILSPLTGSDRIKHEKTISCTWLVERYLALFQVDTRPYFGGLSSIDLYCCLESGYRFYYPFNISGDGSFYQGLSRQPWYYMDWKWEHKVALKLVKHGMHVLEVGCGKGGFVDAVNRSGGNGVGLELNQEQVENGRSRGLKLLPELIEKHAVANAAKYDVVCAFQVMEHICQVKDFLLSCLAVLKPGGRLIVSVPNNDAFVNKGDDDPVLNMPPHHMGLWDSNALVSLGRFFPLRIDGLELEPLQDYHHAWAAQMALKLAAKELGPEAEMIISRQTDFFAALMLSILKIIP